MGSVSDFKGLVKLHVFYIFLFGTYYLVAFEAGEVYNLGFAGRVLVDIQLWEKLKP